MSFIYGAKTFSNSLNHNKRRQGRIMLQFPRLMADRHQLLVYQQLDDNKENEEEILSVVIIGHRTSISIYLPMTFYTITAAGS